MNQSGLRRITGMLLLSTLFVSGCSQNSPAPTPSPDTQQSSDKATEASSEASKEQANYEQLPPTTIFTETMVMSMISIYWGR